MIAPVEVITETRGATALIRLSRPDSLNALSGQAISALTDAVRRADRSPGIAVVLLVGQGRAFCSGADRDELKTLGEQSDSALADALRVGQDLILSILDARPIVVAAVHGYCVGSGLSIALSADICLAAQGTIFLAPEVSHGLPYLWWSTAQMALAVGIHRTKFLTLAGERFGADHARQIGLVASVHPEASLESEAFALATRLAARPRAALFAQKRLSNRVLRSLMQMTGDEIAFGLECVRLGKSDV